MVGTPSSTHSEGLKAVRLCMVLGSISPLFIFWAIQGSRFISDDWLLPICALMVIVPNAVLLLRFRTAKKQADKRVLTVGTSDDHRHHILVYLFAMLLPFYSADLESWRSLSAALAALAFIVFLFWHLNLHYMNLAFALLGYRVFMICPPLDGNQLTGKTLYTVITRRVNLSPGEQLIAYRLSDTVYVEGRKNES